MKNRQFPLSKAFKICLRILIPAVFMAACAAHFVADVGTLRDLYVIGGGCLAVAMIAETDNFPC